MLCAGVESIRPLGVSVSGLVQKAQRTAMASVMCISGSESFRRRWLVSISASFASILFSSHDQAFKRHYCEISLWHCTQTAAQVGQL